MSGKIYYILSAFFILNSGCIGAKLQSRYLLSNLPDAYQLENVGFIDQPSGQCGPASLAMAINWVADPVNLNDLVRQVYTPALVGSLQTDLVSAGRRRGLMAVQIRNFKELLSEVAGGHPVIVFENLALSWYPKWHYALVVGYDLRSEEIIMHSGPNAYARKKISEFERSWSLGNYWGLVVLPAGELSVSAEESAHVTAAVGLEQSGKFKEAEKSYRAILNKWRSSLVALIGLANIYYRDGRIKEAVALLTATTKLHPQSQMARHNLTVASSNILIIKDNLPTDH